jgi:hypothetical protein
MNRFPASAAVLVALALASKAFAEGPTKQECISATTKQECISASERAQALETAGKLSEARPQFALCIAEACPGPVREDCAQRLSGVERETPTLVLIAKDSMGNDVSAVRVTMDGQPFVDSLDGRPVAVDPGQHRFVFDGPGAQWAEATLLIHTGEKDRRERVVLESSGERPARPRAPEGRPQAGGAAEGRTEERGPEGSTQRMAALGVAGAGALSVVIGTVFGIVAKATYDHALGTECGANVNVAYEAKTCSGNGVHDVQTANGQATASTVLFVAGFALAGAGAFFYFSAPKGEGVALGSSIGYRTAGLSIRGTW